MATRGRPKKVKAEQETKTEPALEVPKENPLFIRQRELLHLIQMMKNEGSNDVGNLEVKLSIVNRDIAAL